uniref:ATP synthase complex subunit 8 n=1 Tax=Hemicharilaus monomorphus TaxID=1260737 RepID=M4JDU5_9ORTH|nr:ATP synthase F0 subunit 8 [Hemicharilaus monomorphus]
MPQMSPLMWFSLFIMFSITLILFSQLNFFSFKPSPIKSFESTKKEIMKINWKW